MSKIDSNELSKAIERELKAYAKDTTETMRETVEEITDEAITQLKATSPKRYGKYAKGWKATATKDTNTSLVKKLHNRTPGLTHLLEDGHAKQNGGRVAGMKHIAPVEQSVVKKLESKLKQKL